MATVKPFRADQIRRLVQAAKIQAANKNRKITTVDPIIKTGKTLFPLLSNYELLEYSQTALRIILNEPQDNVQQTTLFAHI